ncbi:hypothetical protein EVAR_5601_1 [Eumeta japonica]|uniref:Integrase catalytic domain-containing protein n=1 Tax=Eumeta variegata TaxID=151549 RepID=A0A4C1U1N9_EUMVA|nr:hypothetical protein EVAR_5601_1 [Eumeta japonica]
MLGQKRPTKREILRTAMSVFDPLGLAAPLTIAAKRILQATWKLGTDWDEEVPDDVYKDWNTWLEHLQALKKLDIPRCYPGCTRSERELHTFVDASEHTYAASTYWRTTAADGSINVSLVMAKARVAPLKITSVPRLELQAAVIGVRLARCTEEGHDVKPDQRVFWTDSRTVLTWIKTGRERISRSWLTGSPRSKKKRRQRNGAGCLQLTMADDATREPPADFDQTHRWFRGPEFLRHPEEEWPSETRAIARSPPTGRSAHHPRRGRTNIIQALPDITRFSSWQRLRRATARALQFIDRCKAGRGLRKEGHAISRRRTQKTDKDDPNWRQTLKKVKKIDKTIHTSANERKFVLRKKVFAASRIVAASNTERKFRKRARRSQSRAAVATNESHTKSRSRGRRKRTLLVKTRVAAASDVTTETKGPPVVDGHHPTSDSTCRPYEQLLRGSRGNKKARLAHHQRPFSYVGLDYFGPYNVTIGRQHQKRYVALFTCLTTRAVHLEVAGGLSADSAILAIRRMMARRGAPVEIWSDNGTNFHGADAELQKTAREAAAQEASARAIDWRYIPPGAPFMGGAWERLVQSIKRALAPSAHTCVRVTDDPALTPNHFLLGGPGRVPLPGSFSDSDTYGRQQWRHAQRLADLFWTRWIREYLPTLQYRREPVGRGNPLAVGDTVIVVDGTLPRNAWMRGRVTATYPGKDGVVRVADITTSTGILRRPTKKMPDFHQPRNKAQDDSERVVPTDIEEHASDTGKLLIELEVDKFGELKETSDIVVSLPTEALLDPEIGNDSEYSNEGDAEYHVTSDQMEVPRDLPYDDDLPLDIATSIKIMETVMDAKQEKLLSGDINFKWRRNFTIFNAVREEFLVHTVGGVKYYDSPYDAFIDIFDAHIMKCRTMGQKAGKNALKVYILLMILLPAKLALKRLQLFAPVINIINLLLPFGLYLLILHFFGSRLAHYVGEPAIPVACRQE